MADDFRDFVEGLVGDVTTIGRGVIGLDPKKEPSDKDDDDKDDEEDE